MTMGPEPMRRILWRSVRFGMEGEDSPSGGVGTFPPNLRIGGGEPRAGSVSTEHLKIGPAGDDQSFLVLPVDDVEQKSVLAQPVVRVNQLNSETHPIERVSDPIQLGRGIRGE